MSIQNPSLALSLRLKEPSIIKNGPMTIQNPSLALSLRLKVPSIIKNGPASLCHGSELVLCIIVNG